MIAETLKCFDCKKEFLEKMTNEQYSEYLKKVKEAKKKGMIGHKWICKDCIESYCYFCKREKFKKFIPVKKGGTIRHKLGSCEKCFEHFKTSLGFDNEIPQEQLKPLPLLGHEKFNEFWKDVMKD